jgi:hypothetical protein
MTVYDAIPDVERIDGHRLLRRANVFFLTGLARIADLTTLREGDDEHDYVVDVPLARLHELDQRVVDLEIDVRERFNVRVRAMAVGKPA